MTELEQAARELAQAECNLQLAIHLRDKVSSEITTANLAAARLRYDRLVRDEGRHQVGVLNDICAFLVELSERGCEWPDAADRCKELIKQLSGPAEKEDEGR